MIDKIKNMTQREKVRFLLEEHEAQNEKYIRLMADFANQKRNHEKELEQVKNVAAKDTVLAMMEFYDVLRIAMVHSPENEELELLMESYLRCLKHAGVEVYGEAGDDFDPDIHEAYSTIKSELGHDKVAVVMKRGCKLNGEIIRYAIVCVAQ